MTPVDRLISNCKSWEAFFRATCNLPDSARGRAPDKGKVFERLAQLYLQTRPEYVSALRHTWRVQVDLPRRIREKLHLPVRDEGIDLIAEARDGTYWAIQCKFRSDQLKPLTYSELSTFTNLAFVACRGISEAVIVHTTTKPIRKRKLLGRTTEIGLSAWLNTTREDWKRIRVLLRGRVERPIPRKPRAHQRKAIAAAKKHFRQGTTRGRLIMPCGTGKSLTSFWIAGALKARTVIIAVPSLALIKQSLEDWTREFVALRESPVPEWLCVCSDETVGTVERDEFVGEIYDLGIPTTTDAREIGEFLTRKSRARKIIFATYQSSAQLARAARKTRMHFDLAILDEAHKTVGEKSKPFATLLLDKNIKVANRLFMTATERVLFGKHDDVLSMDNDAIYGKRFYQLTFKDAIRAKPPIISNYKILTVTISDDRIKHFVRENRLLAIKGDKSQEREAQALAAGVALRRAFRRHDIRHAISFHRSIRAASDFADQNADLTRRRLFHPRVESFHISSKKSAGERAQLLDDFKNEHAALMTNARCLTEGVDIPAIDCVLFADPKQSVIDIVQAAGRALRPYSRKKYGYVMVPLIVPKGMKFEDFAETTEFRRVAQIIVALSTQDERIAVEFRLREYGRRSRGRIVEIEGDVPIGLKIDFPEFQEKIGTKLWERVGRANWRSFEDARDYARSLGFTWVAEWTKSA